LLYVIKITENVRWWRCLHFRFLSTEMKL